MKKSIGIYFSLIFLLLIAFPTFSQAKPKVYNLKITYHLPPTHLISRSIVAAYSPLEKMSGGRIKVHFYPAGSLANGKEAYDAIRNGTADLGHITPSYWPGRFPLLTICELPGLIPNALVGTFAINELMKTTPYIADEFKDVKVLGWFTATPYRLFLKKKINTIAELKGLRIRTAGGYQTNIIEKLGAVPVLMGSGDIWTSLSRGLLNGIPYPYSSVPPQHFYESCKFAVSNLDFGSVVMGQIMNKATWEKLPPDLQAMVEAAAQKCCILCAMNYQNDSSMAIPFLKSKGVDIYDVSQIQKKKFNTLIKPLAKQWINEMQSKGLPGQKVYDAMTKILAKYTHRWK